MPRSLFSRYAYENNLIFSDYKIITNKLFQLSLKNIGSNVCNTKNMVLENHAKRSKMALWSPCGPLLGQPCCTMNTCTCTICVHVSQYFNSIVFLLTTGTLKMFVLRSIAYFFLTRKLELRNSPLFNKLSFFTNKSILDRYLSSNLYYSY